MTNNLRPVKDLEINEIFTYYMQSWKVIAIEDGDYVIQNLSHGEDTLYSMQKVEWVYYKNACKNYHRHTIKFYQGFTDTYNYCEHCNYKDTYFDRDKI
jgi:hypothetical protein